VSVEAEKLDGVEPRLVALFTVVACIATAAAAIQVEMGPLFALPIVGSATVALLAWLKTSFRRPGEPARGTVLYIAAIVALMLEHATQWRSRAPDLVMQVARGWVAPGFVFNERTLVVVFAIGSPALFLLGGFFLVRGRPVGDYMAWLLFVWSLVAGVLQGVLALHRSDALGMATGAAACLPPLILGALGARRLASSSGALPEPVTP